MLHQIPKSDSPSQIEARLDQDRVKLTSALQALGEKLTLDALWSDGLSLIKTNAAPYTKAVDTAVRANPVAVALTAVGIAWLVLGRKQQRETDPAPLAGTKFEALSRWEDEGGPVDDLPGPDDDWMQEAERLRRRAASMIARINAAARDKLAPAADLARSRADVTAALTKDVRRVMARGLDGLTDAARDAALATRESAYTLRLEANRLGAKTVRDAPLVTGIALASAGAALAALLPKSSLENSTFGKTRDHIVAEATRILHDERKRFAGSVNQAAQTLMADIGPKRPRS